MNFIENTLSAQCPGHFCILLYKCDLFGKAFLIPRIPMMTFNALQSCAVLAVFYFAVFAVFCWQHLYSR